MARAAITGIDGVDVVLMSGSRATFTLKAGKLFDEQEFAAAFAEKKMKLETFGKENRPRPTAAHQLSVEGLG